MNERNFDYLVKTIWLAMICATALQCAYWIG